MSTENKISGFSLVRNGLKFDYPFLESWRSLLPLVDELVLNVGKSEDASLEAALSFARESSKVRIIETEWPMNDPAKKKSGLILSEQTNIALDACQNDWCFYIQADEVLHEADYPLVKSALQEASVYPNIEAVVFQYCHFYSSYNVIQETRSAYRREIRMIKKTSGAKSVGDAQSFRKKNGEKLNAILTPARMFHYGWVRTPEAMKEKTFFMDQLYHGDAPAAQPHTGENYRYRRFWGLNQYRGTHPQVMQARICEKGWSWDLKNSPFIFTFGDLKKIILDLYERATGHRPFEFRNYKILKNFKNLRMITR